MRVYRIVQQKYANDLSGEGARLYGGRWNSPGTAVLYTSTNSSLSMLEMLVYLDSDMFYMPFVLMTLEFPEQELIVQIEAKDLSKGWNTTRHPAGLIQLGNAFVRDQKGLAIKVPSSINPLDDNLIINVNHPAYSKVKILSSEPIEFDKRLLGGN